MIVGLLISWALIAVMFAVTTWILPGMEVSGGFWGYLWVSLLFGIVNAIIGTFLRIITFPLTVLTFGLFSILVNAFLLQITDGSVGPLHDRRVLVDGDLGRDHHGDRLVPDRHARRQARCRAARRPSPSAARSSALSGHSRRPDHEVDHQADEGEDQQEDHPGGLRGSWSDRAAGRDRSRRAPRRRRRSPPPR